MKKNMIKSRSRSILLAAMPIVMGLATAVQAAQMSPEGTWDCVISGHRQGTAYLQFFPDNTFTVTEVIVPNAVSTNIINERGGSAFTTGRGESVSGGGFVPGPQIFGEEYVTNGLWGFDNKGRTIGAFIEISDNLTCQTVAVPIVTNNEQTLGSPPVTITNNPTTDPVFCVSQVLLGATNLGGGFTNYSVADECFTNVTVCTAITNTISFVGTVSTKRIVLKASTPFGDTSYEGVPSQTLPDITGEYYGIKNQNGIKYIEFITMLNDEDPNENIYDVSVAGPGYTYLGQAILSSQKKIAFALALIPAIPTNPPVTERAVFGPFNPRKNSATTIGWDAPADTSFAPSDQAHFNIQPEP